MQQQKLPLEDRVTMPARRMIDCRTQANARISRRTGNTACKLRVNFGLILFGLIVPSKHNVSVTGFVSVIRCKVEIPLQQHVCIVHVKCFFCGGVGVAF
jgi:hypothetical protein